MSMGSQTYRTPQRARSALADVWSWLPIERWEVSGAGGKHPLHLPVPEDWAIAGRIVRTIATNGAIFLQGLMKTDAHDAAGAVASAPRGAPSHPNR